MIYLFMYKKLISSLMSCIHKWIEGRRLSVMASAHLFGLLPFICNFFLKLWPIKLYMYMLVQLICSIHLNYGAVKTGTSNITAWGPSTQNLFFWYSNFNFFDLFTLPYPLSWDININYCVPMWDPLLWV